MIMSWTVLKRKSLYYDTYQKIAASFQLAWHKEPYKHKAFKDLKV
jgi:hypothetical protein